MKSPRPGPGARKTVLVAGGAGFLGSHLCDALLADGSRLHVVIPDITRVHWSVNAAHH